METLQADHKPEVNTDRSLPGMGNKERRADPRNHVHYRSKP